MRKLIALSVAFLFCVGLAAAGEGNSVTVEGKILCAKCTLGEQESCQNVLVVENKGDDDYYYLTKNATYEEMGEVCKDSRLARVTGTLEEKDGKTWLIASEIVRVEDEG